MGAFGINRQGISSEAITHELKLAAVMVVASVES